MPFKMLLKSTFRYFRENKNALYPCESISVRDKGYDTYTDWSRLDGRVGVCMCHRPVFQAILT